MAEQIVWNKKLLVIAMVLGLLAVVLFFAYDIKQDKKFTSNFASVLQWTRDMQAGELIQKEDIEVVQVRRDLVKEMPNLLRREDAGLAAPGQPVRRSVSRFDFVRSEDLRGFSGDTHSPADGITPGKRAITLRLDPYHIPGNLLRVGGKVDVMGRLGNPPKTYTLIENLRILAIGGRSEEPAEFQDPGRRSSDSGMRVYRSIVVEMSPTTTEKWMDLEARIQGNFRLLVRKPTDVPDQRKGFDGVINPEVLKLMETLQPIESYDR